MNKLILCLLLVASCLYAQDREMPDIVVKDLEGKQVNLKELVKHNGPVVLSFWATWCKPCILELDNITDQHSDWVFETGAKFIAISVDDVRSQGKVKPFTKSRGWPFEIYLDSNADLKRAFNINEVPHTILINGLGQIVWQHSSYIAGDEELLLVQIRKLK